MDSSLRFNHGSGAIATLLKQGLTLPELLDRGCDFNPNAIALNQWSHRQWLPTSNLEFRRNAEEIALGLLNLAVKKGDRIALLMHSDLPLAVADMGCLLAGLIDVPIDLTQTIENILYILNHSEAKVLIVSDLKLLKQLLPYLGEARFLHSVIVAEISTDWSQQWEQLLQPSTPESLGLAPNACLQLTQFFAGPDLTQLDQSKVTLPHCIALISLTELQQQGHQQWSLDKVLSLRQKITSDNIATIIYIASENRYPKGVMLSHQNISSNVLAAFGSDTNLKTGAAEIALLFLPLTHIFARVFLYGHLAYGHSLYFSDPNRLTKHLRTVRPTILITVPRLLEKIYERIIDKGAQLTGVQKVAFDQAIQVAKTFDVSVIPQGFAALKWQWAKQLVFSQWQDIFGDRLKLLISGGAALRPELVNFFNASGIPVVQGYGLTETSGVLCYNRPDRQTAKSVGLPVESVQLSIAKDGEILVKAPFVMQGYYKDPVATAQVLDHEGWFHTGDLGELNAAGFLTITGQKKALFKLSTGKYVSLKFLESQLQTSPLIHQAIAVGANQKFCGMLIFPNHQGLRSLLQNTPYALTDARVLGIYQQLINQANCHLPYWSTVKKFLLMEREIPRDLFVNGQLNRPQMLQYFAAEINQLYTVSSGADSLEKLEESSEPSTAVACPVYAQSLSHS